MTRNRPSLPLWSPRRLTLALEPRHLFDGAAPAEVAALVQDDGSAAVGDTQAAAPVEAEPRELIVVDSRVAQRIDVESLLAASAKVVVLDQKSDGLAQIAAALDGEQNLSAIHIFSHGSRDGIILGQGLVDQNELQRQSAVLAGIGSALAADGDILLYGCDVAAAMMEPPGGRAMVEESIAEALDFRRAMRKVEKDFGQGDWWFKVWGPEKLAPEGMGERDDWILRANDNWHGFGNLAPGFNILDPIKATVITLSLIHI